MAETAVAFSANFSLFMERPFFRQKMVGGAFFIVLIFSPLSSLPLGIIFHIHNTWKFPNHDGNITIF